MAAVNGHSHAIPTWTREVALYNFSALLISNPATGDADERRTHNYLTF